MKKSDLRGKVMKGPSGHLFYEIYSASSELVAVAAKLLGKKFGLRPLTNPAIGLSEAALNIKNDEVMLGMGWDIASGFYVVAYDEAGDIYIREITQYLNDEFEDPNYERYLSV